MVPSTQHLIESVREETDRMLKATSSAPHDAQVAMPASQFRKLAGWLAQLCDVLEESERGNEGRLGDPRYWVPLANYQKLKADNLQLEQLSMLEAGGIINVGQNY